MTVTSRQLGHLPAGGRGYVQPRCAMEYMRGAMGVGPIVPPSTLVLFPRRRPKGSYITENDVDVAKLLFAMAPKPGEFALNFVCF